LNIQFGKRFKDEFQSGWYVYVGSALNGLIPRIQRHLCETKKMHWHIDHLLTHATISKIYIYESIQPMECMIASRFAKSCKRIPKFGSSDCRCDSHLFYGSKDQLESIISTMDMNELKKQTLKTTIGL
jgi:Uri superfamily endonuclease